MAIEVYQRFSAYYHRAASIILLVGFFIRLFIAICLNPGFDEASYYLYTLHPDWSYFDVPPLVGLTTNIGIWLTGQVSQFTIRIGTLLLYTGSLIFLYATALRLYTLQIAINTLAIASAIPIFQIAFGILSTPNTPLLFFWAMSLWLAAQEFFDYRSYHPSFRLTLIFLTVSLACLGSYHGFFLGFGLIGFCLFAPNYRHALFSKWFLFGIPIFIIAILPLLYWQATHEWVSFDLQLLRSVSTDRHQINRIFFTMLIEMFYLFPSFGVPLSWSIIRTVIHQFRSLKLQHYTSLGASKTQWDLEKRGLILWLSLPIIIGVTFISGDRQILADDKMPGFWIATILLAERILIVRRNSRNGFLINGSLARLGRSLY
jgi:Dolichyl-phosphate-mannose-protein mannosyltransferase